MNTLTPAKPSSYAWLVVGLLIPVVLLNYLDRQLLASMKTSIMADIPGIGQEANWGKVLAFFKWTYAAFSPIGGYLADRFSRRHIITGSLMVWSAVTWATGHVQSYEQLLAARALMGVSEAFYFPAALALIADCHTGGTRSRAVGLHQMGLYAGVIIGGFSGYAAEHPSLGWRWAFDICGIVGIAYAVPLFLMLRQPAGFQMAARTEEKASPRAALGELLGNRSFILLVLCFTLPALAAWVVRDWMPAILKKEFAIGQGRAGVSATLYWQLAAIVGAICGGWLADRWMQRSERGRIYVSAIGIFLIVPAMFGVGFAPKTGLLWVAVAFLILFGLGWGFFDCNNMPILSQIARPSLRATGYGLMNFVSISCGGVADWSFGAMSDQGLKLEVIFSVFAAAAVVAVCLMLMIRPKRELLDSQTTPAL